MFLKAGNKIINAAVIAWAEKTDLAVVLHLAFASENSVLHVTGADATELWKDLEGLAKKRVTAGAF